MTLRQVVDNTLAVPDQKTQENNIKTVDEITKKLSKEDQQKMQTVLQGMKQQQAAAQKQQQEQNKTKLPTGGIQTTAQPIGNNTTAQSDNNGDTAQ